jgi:hypothetical protein
MLYLFADKKITRYARIAIYGSGIFLLGLFFYVNVFQIEIRDLVIQNNPESPLSFYEFPTNRPASKFEITVTFREDQSDLSEFQALIGRTHGALLRERSNMILEAKDLRKEIMENSLPGFPSGSLVEYGGIVYLIDDFRAHPLTSKDVFKKFGFNPDKIREISDEDFSQLEIDDPIKEEDLNKENFPANIIIRSGQSFFITGSKRVTPIFSEEIIRQTWPSYHYIEAGPIDDNALENMECYVLDAKTVKCYRDNPAPDAFGSEYVVSFQGVGLDRIEKVKARTVFWPTGGYALQRLKELAW